MIFDTHAHYDDEAFNEDRDAVLRSLAEHGIEGMFFVQGVFELLEDVALMKKTVGERAKVKASGGIRTPEAAKALVEAGADRIGAGNGIVLL